MHPCANAKFLLPNATNREASSALPFPSSAKRFFAFAPLCAAFAFDFFVIVLHNFAFVPFCFAFAHQFLAFDSQCVAFVQWCAAFVLLIFVSQTRLGEFRKWPRSFAALFLVFTERSFVFQFRCLVLRAQQVVSQKDRVVPADRSRASQMSTAGVAEDIALRE